MSAAEELMRLIKAYARVRRGVVSILEASGQDRFKIHVKSLYRVRRHVEISRPTVEDLLREVESREEELDRLREAGVRIVREGRELYVEVPSELLIKAAKQDA